MASFTRQGRRNTSLTWIFFPSPFGKKFDLDWRIASADDEEALSVAFRGCEVVVQAVMGQLSLIEKSVTPTYKACVKAGVKRLVYISTASVHGQNPPQGTHEGSVLNDTLDFAYNNYKIRAERRLRTVRNSGDTEIVILRPGIVFGPRDRWVSGIAHELSDNRGFVVAGGRGICNSIYVDNLCHAIWLSATIPCVDKEAFIVGDAERITWYEMTCLIAEYLNVPLSQILDVPTPVFNQTWKDRFNGIRGNWATQKLLPLIPADFKRFACLAIELAPIVDPDTVWDLPKMPTPNPTVEFADCINAV